MVKERAIKSAYWFIEIAAREEGKKLLVRSRRLRLLPKDNGFDLLNDGHLESEKEGETERHAGNEEELDWCSLAWVCCITVNLYFNLVKEIRTDHFAVAYYVAAWGVPFILSCLPLFGDYYGPAGAWCWITDDHVAWRFGIWYIPLFVLIFLMMSCYIRIFYVAKRRAACQICAAF
ncbi:cyclic AMP receptor-like protein A [Rhincodon typus]|uniref:cyclic AMP receptor-like protein A n=1 Tax=Rhincodon typus TaxID=259920 RepID=UPI00202EB43C|nr:cyclic AMP receptor-like protein A [Rhincodon typus]